MWHRKRSIDDFDEEIRAHIELEAERLKRRGVPEEEARRRAYVNFGNVMRAKERFYESRRPTWFSDLIQDLQYAARMLSRSRGIAIVAILTLALGIGANTAIFSVLDPLLLQNLPVRDPNSLVRVDAVGTISNIGMWEGGAYERFRDEDPAFSGVMSFNWGHFDNVGHDGRSSSVSDEIVTANYFTVLGLSPLKGRLTFEDSELGNAVVLGFDYWRREFATDSEVIGKTLIVDGAGLTIVGVTPPQFFGMRVGESADIYIPSSRTAKSFGTGWGLVIARLKPTITIEQALQSSAPVFAQIRKESEIPEIEKRQEMDHLVLSSAARGLSSVRGQFSFSGQILMAVSVLLLLIACANVANLLLAQGDARKREIAVRLAMGAGRKRLVRQLLTEGGFLAITGMVAGLVVARWTSKWIVASLSDFQTRVVLATPLNMHVLFFSLATSIVTVLLCAAIPAFHSTRLEISQDMKSGSAGSRHGANGKLSRTLVVAQVTMSVTALIAGGMLLHSLVNLETMDVGFDRDHLIAVDWSLDGPPRTPPQMKTFNDRLMEQIGALPDVRSVTRSSFAPVSGRMIGVNVRTAGRIAPPGEEPHAFIMGVTSGYFSTLGISVLQGGDFPLQDTPNSPFVCLISRSLAHHYFNEANPIGSQLEFVEGGKTAEIIGIVEDSKYYDIREEVKDLVYLPLRGNDGFVGGRTMIIRTGGTPASLQAQLPKIFRAFDPLMHTTRVETLRERIDDSLHVNKLIAVLSGAFSIVALSLTGVGLYGLLAFNVSMRTGEIGLRMALGADRKAVFRLVITQGLRLVGIGLLLGSATALSSATFLKKILFGVGRFDLVTLVGVCLLLGAISAWACYWPARRAAQIDPLIALRND